ncbi:MAG TPA: hypothetical protein VIL48_10370 [Acidimicrobiales bacterium]
MDFAVETWAPDYGAPVGAAVLDDSDATVDLAVERDPGDWAPIGPEGVAPAPTVLFVDGVQRIDARVWITEGGLTRSGVCASWAAGVVRCDGRAEVVAAEVRRGVLCPGGAGGDIATERGDYRAYPVPDTGTGDPVEQALGRARGDLEGRVAAAAGRSPAGGELLVVDGPLGDRRHIAGAVGYIKAHHVSYLPAALQHAVTGLRPGQRTPLFAVGDRRFRYSWYLRLPGPATHPWWGIVRCEASGDLSRVDAAAVADRVGATLPRFASQPHNDHRAPQNLHPIAGLERELRRRLGDPLLLERALRRAASPPVPA